MDIYEAIAQAMAKSQGEHWDSLDQCRKDSYIEMAEAAHDEMQNWADEK